MTIKGVSDRRTYSKRGSKNIKRVSLNPSNLGQRQEGHIESVIMCNDLIMNPIIRSLVDIFV